MSLLYLGAGFQPAEHLLDVAQVAEECGFDGLALPDHVGYPLTTESKYPSESGDVPWSLDETPWIDPWIALSAVAAATTRLRLMTHIFVLPLRDPVLVAKTVGSAAALFPGRMEFGIGVGWNAEEFALVGAEFGNRGARTDESIEVLRALWGPQPASYEGKHYSFTDVAMFPRPSAPVPILVGGSSAAALERAVRVGDGFVAMPATVAETGPLVARLREGLARHGRPSDGFHINTVPSDVDGPDALRRLEDLGVTSVQVHPFTRDQAIHGSLTDKLDAVRRWAERMMGSRTTP
jgi:probable F420-dependent oxidoreductase